MLHRPKILQLMLVAVLIAANPVTHAAELPLTSGTVIEWRSPHLSKTASDWDWHREHILAVNGNVTRYRSESRVLEVIRQTVIFDVYRGLIETRRHMDNGMRIARFAVPPAQLDGLFPLVPNRRVRLDRSVEHEFYRDLRRPPEVSRFPDGADEIVIEQRETIEIPAGRFDTFVLLIERLTQYDLDHPGERWRQRDAQRVWYAPQLGWPVKRQPGKIGANGFVPDSTIWSHVVAIRRP